MNYFIRLIAYFHIFTLCVFGSLMSESTQMFNKYCTLSNENELKCTNFSNFSQLDFSNLTQGNINSLEFIPSEPIELNDSDLDFNGLRGNLENDTLIKLKKISGFLFSYKNLDIFENLTLYLDDSSFEFRQNNGNSNR